MDWYADGTGKVRIGVGFNDETRSSRLLYRGPDGGTFRTFNRASARRGEELTVPALFLQEPGKALAFDGKSGHQALYELDLATMAIGKQVFAVPGHDVGSLISDARARASPASATPTTRRGCAGSIPRWRRCKLRSTRRSGIAALRSSRSAATVPR